MKLKRLFLSALAPKGSLSSSTTPFPMPTAACQSISHDLSTILEMPLFQPSIRPVVNAEHAPLNRPFQTIFVISRNIGSLSTNLSELHEAHTFVLSSFTGRCSTMKHVLSAAP
eukprot:gb/GECG01005086.1/.p1 GENE.gb/GECG01005086.1/~~gb/GECG01005086.1/.p1  ORF type:complete len:113 (+),score=5.80 gb/GECG01005086.1/:1-339(+)